MAIHNLRTMNLSEICERAWWSLEDHPDAVVERLQGADDLTCIRYFYQHDACDYFAVALHRMTGWPIVALNGPQGSMHRLNQAPCGRLVDASGWTTIEALRREYRLAAEPELSQPAGEALAVGYSEDVDNEGFDENLVVAVSAIRQLPHAPFNSEEFAKTALCPVEGVDYPFTDPAYSYPAADKT